MEMVENHITMVSKLLCDHKVVLFVVLEEVRVLEKNLTHRMKGDECTLFIE